MELIHFRNFFEDHVREAKERFQHDVGAAIAQTYGPALEANLYRRLFEVVHKPLMLLHGRSRGRVSDQHFLASLLEPEVRRFIHDMFPMLETWMGIACTAWATQAGEVATRYEHDRSLIGRALSDEDAPMGLPAAITFGAGDTHRGGRSVAIVRTAQGRHVVYKPRGLSIDQHFHGLLEWIEPRTGVSFLKPRCLDRGAYGWQEFIEPTACATEADVDAFYFELGCYLAILYALEGSDMHYENIIACGGHPVLIDLETLFRPHSRILGTETNEALDSTILQIGLLPSLDEVFSRVSGLSDVEGAAGVVERLQLVPHGDGTVSLARAKGTLKGGQNVPMLDGARVIPNERHKHRLKHGFERTYRAILRDRDELRALLGMFEHDTIRILIRHTLAYSQLLDEGRHPNLLASPAAFTTHVARLEQAVADYPPLAGLVGYEKRDIGNGDIPLFTTTAASLDIRASEQDVVTGYFAKSGMDAVREKIGRLSEQDLGQQLWLLDRSLGVHEDATLAAADRSPEGDAAQQPQLLAFVNDFLERWKASLHEDETSVHWVVSPAKNLDGDKHAIAVAFYDLYYGIPGMILLLASAERVSASPRHEALIAKAIRTLQTKVERDFRSIRPIGLYTGWAGLVFLATKLHGMGRPAFLRWLEGFLPTVGFDALIDVDHNLSLVKGGAGWVAACAEWHLASGSPLAIELAAAAAEHLIRRADRSEQGLGWRIVSEVPLSGLGHGCSGFAYAFSRLYAATGDQRFADVAAAALVRERLYFVPSQRNWRDCRKHVTAQAGEAPFCSTAWSHGAPGIGLARLQVLRSGIADPLIESELRIAIDTTIRYGLCDNDSVVYGNFGNVELLLAAATTGRFPQAASALADFHDRLLERLHARRNAWATAAVDASLMAGDAGVAYQCLRLHAPQVVDSVLCGD